MLAPGFTYHVGFLACEEADAVFSELRSKIAWRNETLTIFGKPRVVPRLVAWYGDAGAMYRYSGLEHRPLPWIPALSDLRERCERFVQARFRSVLANLYRGNLDSMGWHSDDEPELGATPTIASVSLGATRRFHIRRRSDGDTKSLDLEHGSLLLMRDDSQRDYQHALPKIVRQCGERINLTFRDVHLQ